jgi:uncharacterized lipoprotein YmbA
MKKRGRERGYMSFCIPEAKRVVSVGVCVELLETDPTWTQMKEMRVESCWNTLWPKRMQAAMRALLEAALSRETSSVWSSVMQLISILLIKEGLGGDGVPVHQS